MTKKILSITDKALEQVAMLLQQRDKDSFGIRVGVKSGGCSGFKYFLEYADEKAEYDEVINDRGITILIDPKALMYIIGSEMDYVQDEFNAGFVFVNPNEKAKCGCGKSFSA